MKLALLAICFVALGLVTSADAEEFSVGGFRLSEEVRATGLDGGEDWDQEGNHRTWLVTLIAEEPVLRYSVSVQSSKRGEAPMSEHLMTVYATDRSRAFLIDFDGALHTKDNARSRDFEELCARDVAALGGATKTMTGFSPTDRVQYSIILDRGISPNRRTKIVAGLDASISAWKELENSELGFLLLREGSSPAELTRGLKFKELAATLTPDFRGAIVACGWRGDISVPVWETRFLDLPLAASVFNLVP